MPWYRTPRNVQVAKVANNIPDKIKNNNIESFVLLHDIIKFGDENIKCEENVIEKKRSYSTCVNQKQQRKF